jgi:hypothetical protein
MSAGAFLFYIVVVAIVFLFIGLFIGYFLGQGPQGASRQRTDQVNRNVISITLSEKDWRDIRRFINNGCGATGNDDWIEWGVTINNTITLRLNEARNAITTTNGVPENR